MGALCLRKNLRKLDFTTEWVAMPDSIKRAGHLVASRRPSAAATKSSSKIKSGKRLFLIGHLDTVFEPDMPANPFTMLNDSTATGQGVNDMKGGDVVVIMALQALEQAGLLKNTAITAYFTGDEEHAGYPRSKLQGVILSIEPRKTDIALAFEGCEWLKLSCHRQKGCQRMETGSERKNGS